MHPRAFVPVSSVLMLAMSLSISSGLLADDAADTIVNPQYTAWANFQPGSSASVAMNIKSPDGRIRVEVTSVLKTVDDSGVTLEVKVVRTVAGQQHPAPQSTTKYEHMMKRANLTALADQDVVLSGKSYPCKVYEVSSSKAGGAGGDNSTGGKSKIYLNDTIPGGVVKMELPNASSQPIIMTLSAFHAVTAHK